LIKLLIVDDQPSVRAGLRMLVNTAPDITVVGEADNGEEALALAQQVEPDVALVDIEMPRMDGLTATKALRKVVPGCAVVILTFYDDARNRERARDAGAVAFLGKQAAPSALLATIRQAT
jgi:DNA-binding NarL/FixJ family response regulator